MSSYDAGTMLAIKGFSAAMLGGMSSAAGPLVGGLLIGLLEAFGAGYLSSTYKDVTALAVLLAVLAFRPQGLFGGRSVSAYDETTYLKNPYVRPLLSRLSFC